MDTESFAFDFRCSEEVISSVILDFDLFVIDGDSFGSISIQNRLEERNAKSNKARENALKRWNKTEKDANALQTDEGCIAIKESKEKEKKDNDLLSEQKAIFEEFRVEFLGSKRGIDTEFANFAKRHKDWKECLPLLKPAFINQLNYKKACKENNLFVPQWKNLQTWLNQREWEVLHDKQTFEKNKSILTTQKTNY